MSLRWLTAVSLAATTLAAQPEPRFTHVEAIPAAVELDGSDSYVQLLLTGFTAIGARLDVTREARLATGCELVDVSPTGLIRPRRDGAAELAFEIEGHTVRVPLRVRGVDEPLHPSFVQDVMPILSRLGCNAGTCHGSADGKNGFKLSLRGYDPAADHLALTDDLAGRRFDRAAPSRSLFLLKPTGAVAHEGGRRLVRGDADYEVLRHWVEDGVRLDRDAPRVASIELSPDAPTIDEPGARQQFRVIASYPDGRTRDVTAHAFFETSDLDVMTVDEHGLATTRRRGDAALLARYEGRYASTRLFVMGDRDGFAWREVAEHNYVDSLIYARLREIKTQPSGLCSDAEFLRRVHLDLTGRPPTPSQVDTFLLDDRDTRIKRDEVIDRLIGGAAFVEHWTNRWADLLQVNSKFLGGDGARRLRTWIRTQVASNRPYDQFVRELLTASGSTIDNPPAAFHKIAREPDAAMEITTQLFMGVRFNCNKCHDHPFERWTKTQHWELASYFAQVERKDAPGSPQMPASAVRLGQRRPAYEELVGDRDDGDAIDPDGRRYGAGFPFAPDGIIDATETRRVQLAQWLTEPGNEYFATSYVNRVWSYFLGIGFIDPVDDLRASNPPTFPKLLEKLTADFVAGGFDVRRLVRLICRSRVYQHSIEANEWNRDDRLHYARAMARRLPAETLYDAVHQATGTRPRLSGARVGSRAAEAVDASVEAPDGFLDLFGRPARESACECERNNGMSLGQALNLVNGPTVAEAIRAPDNDIAQLVAFEREPGTIIEELYVRFLCRPPTQIEVDELTAMFDPGDIANASGLSDADHTELMARFERWQAAVPRAVWHPLDPGDAKSAGGAELVELHDRSLLLKGPKPAKDDYTIVAWTDRPGITGLRLEALPHESLPNQGPGRADNGNFVLAHLEVTAVPLDDPTSGTTAKWSKATASFSQGGFSVAQTLEDSARGWAISPQLSRRQVAVFELTEDLGASGGALLILKLKQPYGGSHTLGRFRWSVTTSKRPIRHSGIGEELEAILNVAEAERSPAQRAELYRHFVGRDPELQDKLRLGAAQDLAWALANSSAFLFNR